MKRILCAAVLLWASIFSLSALAQEADAEASADAAASATAAGAEPDTGDETADADTESSEVFIPTEEISEDFAVSFPVDI